MADQQDPIKELDAMKAIAVAFTGLDATAINRVLTWANDVYRGGAAPAAAGGGYGAYGGYGAGPGYAKGSFGAGVSLPAGENREKLSVADFYAATAPQQEYDKALVIGYWLQVLEGAEDFDAQTVNSMLKNLGHRVGNITSAFDSLMGRRPQLVVQTKKSGTSRQARKKYRVTLEGQRSVEKMLQQEIEA